MWTCFLNKQKVQYTSHLLQSLFFSKDVLANQKKTLQRCPSTNGTFRLWCHLTRDTEKGYGGKPEGNQAARGAVYVRYV